MDIHALCDEVEFYRLRAAHAEDLLIRRVAESEARIIDLETENKTFSDGLRISKHDLGLHDGGNQDEECPLCPRRWHNR